jgi:hypothetical protein
MIRRLLRKAVRHAACAARRTPYATRPLRGVLLYHRIATPGVDPFALCVTPRHFEQQMSVLRRHFRCLQLGELTEWR